MTVETITLADLHASLQGQGVSSKNHFAFRCPICSTIQSAQDLIDAGAGTNFDAVENKIGFSCIGRFTEAGLFKAGSEPGLAAIGLSAACSAFTSLKPRRRTALDTRCSSPRLHTRRRLMNAHGISASVSLLQPRCPDE